MGSIKAEIEKIRREVGKVKAPVMNPDHLREIQRCKQDSVYFICTYVYTYDPRVKPQYMPFELYPKQVEFIRWLEDRYNNREDGVAEKSRDTGLTWCSVAFLTHKWLFDRGFKGTVGSRKQDLVDRLGDTDSIFEKFRMVLRRLPEFLLPRNYQDSFCKLINYDIGSIITGEAGDNMGRGGRSSIYIVDEFAFIERPQRVDAAISANCDCKIYVSTPNGQGNLFYDKRVSENFPVFTLHWEDDPRKGEEWYARQKATLDPIILAQEVDIDYTASMPGIIVPAKHVRAAIGYALKPSGNRYAGLDVAGFGSNLNVLTIRQGSVVIGVHSWGGENTTQTAFKAIQIAKENHVSHINIDSVGVGEGVVATFTESKQMMGGITFSAINSGSSPTDAYWQAENRTSKDKFLNLRSEMWWGLRDRFRKTWEVVNKVNQYLENELISIPNESKLISQLSTPIYRFNQTGKLVIEAKADMRKRGAKSPDFADSAILAFAPPTATFKLNQYHVAR